MKKIVAIACFFTFPATISHAGMVDSIAIYSQSMKKDIKTVVITPDDYPAALVKYPVVYLLHGYGGNYSNWVTKVPSIIHWADVYHIIIVCPDAAFGSWYFDSPVDSTFRYETFISTEVPNYIDAHYKTIANRKGRAIAGLSMGGHGALFIGFRHADTFGACGSMSGALNITKPYRARDTWKRLGDSITNAHYYRDWSVFNLVEHYPKDSIAIILDCGTNDKLWDMTKTTHEKMLQLNIPHDYIERPGKHEWPYWTTAIKYQLLFFNEFFNKNK